MPPLTPDQRPRPALSRWASIRRDRLRRVAVVDGRRLVNGWRLWREFKKATAGRAEDMSPLTAWPMSLSVEPTTACNLRCPECPSGLRSFTRPTGMLDPDRLSGLLIGPEGLGRDLVYLNLYFQGEPYLHPGMDDLVQVGKQAGLYVSTSTNAHHIDGDRAESLVRSGIDRLIISIDGADQAAYSSYRVGGKLDKVLAGTRAVIEAKRRTGMTTPHVVWQFLVVGTNEHQLNTLKRMAASFEVDEFVVKTAQLDQPEDGHPLLTRDPALRRYDRSPDGRWTLRNPLLDRCWRMWQGAVVTWDGQVVPCCFDKDATHAMGTAEDGAAFRSIWRSERYQAFRRSILTDRSAIDMCRNCSEGTQVWA
jgi:radical SAM protein with 4Fe4S-binding SPASM domain